MEKFNAKILIDKIKNEALQKAKNGKWIQDVNKTIEKKHTKGSFTEWCGGKVTNDCIERGLKSKDERIRKRAQLAKNFRDMKKKEAGGAIDNNINISSYVEDLKNNYLSKLNDNFTKNMIMNVAEKTLDLEDAYLDNIKAAQRVMELEKELYGGLITYEDGGQYVQQEERQQQPKLSYEDFVKFIMSYPDYLEQFIKDLQQQTQQPQ